MIQLSPGLPESDKSGVSSKPWTSRRRLLTALACGTADRVPISTYELVGCNSHAWENTEPSYQRLMDRIRADTDCIAMWGPAINEREGQSAHPTPVDQTTERLGDLTRTTRIIHTPLGDLRTVGEVYDHVHTTWHIEHLCKSVEDVDKAMSIPYQPFTFDYSDLARIKSEVGERGIIMESIGDPAYLAADLMKFEEFTVWAFAETEHFARTVDQIAERVIENLRQRLSAGVVDVYRICGPEYFTPPYLPPEMFRRFMLPHLKTMTRMIHDAGGKVRLHCHGKIARVLDMILDTEPDGIDPCEPPPDGDLELDQVKRRCAERGVSVFGNIELKVLESGTPGQVRDEVRRIMDQAKAGGGFVIMPTAAPINVPLAAATEANYFAYIDAALEYGVY